MLLESLLQRVQDKVSEYEQDSKLYSVTAGYIWHLWTPGLALTRSQLLH